MVDHSESSPHLPTQPLSADEQHDVPDRRSNIFGEPTFCGYTESELLARYPQLRDLPSKMRLRKMVRYACIDRQWELFMEDLERRHGS